MQPSKAEIKMMIMKKNIIHATLAAAMMILVASCSKNEVIAPDDVRRDGISFSASGADTRALINRADLLTDGSKVKVHDDLFGFTGKLDGVQKNAGDVTAYIDDAIVYGNGGWSYESTDAYYPWTKTGTHKFFGWLTYDAKSNLNLTDLVPSAPELKGDTLKVPSVSMTPDKSQFDFLYSESIFRDAAKDDRGAINLHLKHLFTAVGFKFVNRSSSDQISIKSVVFKMPHTASADILFLDSDPNPDINRESDADDYFSETYSAPIVLYDATAVSADPTNKHSQYNPVEKTYTDDNEFFLLWPASASEIAPQNPDGTQTNELVEIVYSINGGEDVTARMNFTSFDLIPGRKHLFNFQFIDKQVVLAVSPIPWDYVEGNVSFYDASVSGTRLDVINYTPTTEGNVIIDKATPATGTFNVMTPVGGRLTVGTSGDTEYFKVSLDHNDINSHDNKFTVTIAPVTTIGGSGTKRIQFHFTVEAPNGRSISADSVIDPDKYQYVFEL